MHDYSLLFFRALAVSITVETTVIAVFFLVERRGKLSCELAIRLFLAGVAATGCTLPFVWFAFPVIIENRPCFLVAVELFAFVVEIPIIRSIVKTSWIKAAAASLLANSASFICGILAGIT